MNLIVFILFAIVHLNKSSDENKKSMLSYLTPNKSIAILIVFSLLDYQSKLYHA